jgi:predicted negative regulator of RcsB-dependent stress response
MPIYKQLPRGKPKKPDEFISFFDHLYHKAYANGPMVLAVLAILALVGLGTLFWGQFHERRSEKLSEKLYEASTQGGEEQEKLLEDIKKSNLYAPLGMWASLQLANRAMDEKKCDKVIDELSRYVGHGENVTLRSLIYLKTGACFEDKKDWKKAEELYQQGRSDSKNILKDWCSLHLAAVYQAEGKKDEAKQIFDDLLQKDASASAAVKEQARMSLSLSS